MALRYSIPSHCLRVSKSLLYLEDNWALSIFFSPPLMELYESCVPGLLITTLPGLSHLIHTQVLMFVID